MMKFSANFDSVDVNEIGLRFLLKSQIVRDFREVARQHFS